MYRRVRERIIAAEVMKLERRQASERAERRARPVPGSTAHIDRNRAPDPRASR
jgi:hypothetical protein